MENMIKFYRGLVSNLPTTGVNGALYITTDEGAIYYGTGTGMKRLGDFIQVANVAALPEKAHESCLYYCVAENILAKWNGSEWKQINKQPTAEELKTLLGLGSLAYKSEVAEGDLEATLKEKINTVAQGNHSHKNLELLETYTQTEANLADAVAKKHSHTFVESELNKIVDGDVAKWNAAEGNAKSYVDEKIAALDYTDTAVEGEYVSAVNEVDGKISVTRKALPDYTNVYEAKGEAAKVQGELNTYKEANDIALANVKATAEAAYVKPATGIAKTDLSAEVQNSLGKADTALQSHQNISHLAVKSDVETELGKKVDKTVYEGKVSELEGAINGKVAIVTGKSLVLDTEINKLTGVSEGANKVENVGGGKIKIDGEEVVVYAHPEKHAISEVDGLQAALDGKQAAGNYSEVGHKHVKADITDFAHTHTKSEITDFAHTHVASEITDLDATIKSYDYATKTELGNVDKKFADYVKSSDYATDKAGIDEAIADRYTKSEADEKFAIKGADAYDDEEVRGLISDNADTISALAGKVGEVPADKTVIGLIGEEKTRAEGIEAGLRSDVDVIKGDYLKSSDKEDLQGQINLIMNNPDTKDVIDSISEFTQYIADHGEIAEGFRKDIDANKKAIEDHEALAAETYETKEDAGKKLTEAKGYTDTEVAKDRERLGALEAVKDDYKTADATLKSELQGEIDADVKVVADDLAAYKTSNDAEVAKKANSADVYAKTETYTKSEIEALLTWGSF